MANLVKRTNTNVLEVLQPGSEVLENLTQDFHTMLRSREQAKGTSIHITCFAEELPVSRAGKTFMVVPPKSATLERYPYVTIHADHVGMTKFKERNNDYKRVALQLKRWMKDLVMTGRILDETTGPVTSDVRVNASVLLGVNVPKKRVSHFVTRTELVQKMDEWLLDESKGTSVVLLGMGGSGKTQLALECCRRAEADSNFTAVIWIDASSPTTVAQSYNTVALKVAGGSENIISIEESTAIVEDALQEQRGRWLAVYDNFDSPRSFEKHDIQHYIPKAKNGRVLFTSRNTSSERMGYVLRVSGMSEDESLDLLLQRPVPNARERQHGLEIAAMLGNLPLALDQAGAYIRARNLPLQEFGSHYARRKRMVLEGVPDQWEYRRKLGETEKETLLSVFITCELSFAQIGGSKEERDSKEHFLSLAAYFDNKCSSERYYEAYCKSYKIGWMQIFMTDGEWDRCMFGDTVAEFRKLSLLQMPDQQANEIQFSLHPVVRDWLKVRKDREEQRLYGSELTALLTSYIETVDFEELDLQIKQETLLHIDACVQTDREMLGELCGSGWEYRSHSASMFAGCYYDNGQYDEAEELYKRALAGIEEKLGPKHFDTLRMMHDLANVYMKKGRSDEAEELYKRAFAGIEEKLGPKHPDTLTTLQNLAALYRKKGRYDEAEELYKRALAGYEEKLGPKHPNTLIAVQYLAISYAEKGRYHEAEELYKRALAGREEKLGPKHPDTLATVQNLGVLYMEMGRYDEAEELYKRALAGSEEKPGPKYSDTLRTVRNLANLYAEKGRYDEAEELYKRALAGNEEKLGPKHPDTLWTVMRFIAFLEDRERADEANALSARYSLT
ncbi:MAG: hypothetical protein LQ340_005415 [Diploschistes diacapsis]|nr:MAG: hypothetical protein LQ340_005415 [Diploschistes diacapsis]